jgi:hypothetical protein
MITIWKMIEEVCFFELFSKIKAISHFGEWSYHGMRSKTEVAAMLSA